MAETGERTGGVATAPRADVTTLMAFGGLVVIGGANAVAVRFSNLELPPFWGAAARFALAAVIFWAILLFRRVALPRGRSLTGSILYGVLSVGASYALLYWGLVEVQATVAVVLLSLGPLITMLLAVAHGLEPFRLRGLVGSLLALVGIVVGIGIQFGGSVPVPSLLALLAGVVCIAEGSVVYKYFPSAKPLPANVVAITTGAGILVLISLVAGEAWFLPSDPATVTAFSYLVVIGTVGLFYLYLVVLSRWTASATSYAFLLFPLATIVIAALFTDERVSWGFAAGAVIALAGVWIGAFSGTARKRATTATESCEPPSPGCA